MQIELSEQVVMVLFIALLSLAYVFLAAIAMGLFYRLLGERDGFFFICGLLFPLALAGLVVVGVMGLLFLPLGWLVNKVAGKNVF